MNDGKPIHTKFIIITLLQWHLECSNLVHSFLPLQMPFHRFSLSHISILNNKPPNKPKKAFPTAPQHPQLAKIPVNPKILKFYKFPSILKILFPTFRKKVEAPFLSPSTKSNPFYLSNFVSPTKSPKTL
jgi:hypothetical protein